MPSDALADFLDTLLVAAEAGLAQSRTGRALPKRRYVSHGPPAMHPTCDTLAVYPRTIEARSNRAVQQQALPGGQCVVVPVLNATIEWWRCVPKVGDDGPTMPTPADLSASARALLIDAWALLTYLIEQRCVGTLVGTGTSPDSDASNVTIGTTTLLPPAGGFGGYRVELSFIGNAHGPPPVS